MILEPNRTALVFPGQGSQTVGMGQDLANAYPVAKKTFDEAEDSLGVALSEIMWTGPDTELNDTVNTQPALYLHSIAAQRVLLHLYPNFVPASVSGHSLGELSALTAAGALAFPDGLRLVRVRGELMKRAGEVSPGSMAAVLGLDIPALEKVCQEASVAGEIVQVANDNCPGQVVISGARPAVERAIAIAKASGAKRGIPLAVSIAAHSPLMASIQEEWNQAVDACRFTDPSIPVISNVQAKPMTTASELRADIKAQLQSRVRWTESVQGMLDAGTNAFVELGSGNVLTGLIRRIAGGQEVSCFPLGSPQDLEVF